MLAFANINILAEKSFYMEKIMIPIIIPAYEPDERMLDLLDTMKKSGLGPVVIVDDGSGASYADIFSRAQSYVQVLGLRGIPRAFMKELLDVPGERFEFETRMLLESAGRYPIVEVPIQTIYDSEDNHQTHFNTFTDSVKIYRILADRFLKYAFASVSSCVIDLALFALFCHIFRGRLGGYIAVSTVLARVISAVYNYLINYRVVFRSRQKISVSGTRYFLLAVVQMGLSALLVTAGNSLLPFLPEVVVKAVVDTVLFFISYKIQQKYVFR